MNKFLKAAEIILVIEGGLVDDPTDRGGRTNLGITQNTLNMARKVISNLPEKVDNLTKDQSLSIYKKFYWDEVKCDELPVGIDFLVFDCAVNCGTVTSVKQLQTSLNMLGNNLKIDGLIGPLTINSSKSVNKNMLANVLSLERVKYYNAILKKDKTQLKFIHGWLNRVFRNLDIIVKGNY